MGEGGHEISYTFIIIIVPKQKPNFLGKKYHDWSSRSNGNAMRSHLATQPLRRWIKGSEYWFEFLFDSLAASRISSLLFVSFMLDFPVLSSSSHCPSLQSCTSMFTLDRAGTAFFLGVPWQPSIFSFFSKVLLSFLILMLLWLHQFPDKPFLWEKLFLLLV